MASVSLWVEALTSLSSDEIRETLPDIIGTLFLTKTLISILGCKNGGVTSCEYSAIIILKYSVKNKVSPFLTFRQKSKIL